MIFLFFSEPPRRTDFSNIMDELSMERNYSMRKLSLNLSKKLAEIETNADEHTQDGCDEDVVGPLCTSMKKLNSTTETPTTSLQQEKNYEQQMKTPSELNTSNKMESNQLIRGITHRKSLVFDSGLTPHVNESITPNGKSTENDSCEKPKAKTSLTFNEPTISVKSFYGRSMSEQSVKPTIDSMKISSHQFAAALTKSKAKMKKKSQSLAKRMKAKVPSLWRFSGTNKFNKNKRHLHKPKISKNKTQNRSNNDMQIVEVEVEPINQQFTSNIEHNLRLQKILKDQTNAFNASHDIDWTGASKVNRSTSDSMPLFMDSDDEDDENDDPLMPKQNIQPEPLLIEQNDVMPETVEPTNRKFFKSSANNSAKKYRIMGRLSATVKRGGDLKMEPLPKRKKRKPNEGKYSMEGFHISMEYNFIFLSDTIILNTEISSIIDRLSSPSKSRDAPIAEKPNLTTNEVITMPSIDNDRDFIVEMQINAESSPSQSVRELSELPNVNKYREMIPYNTIDPVKISQQESILELLITNGICDDETFKIFIAEPDSHKDEASKILDSLYCVNTMIPETYENETPIEWIDTIQSASILLEPTTDEVTPASSEQSSNDTNDQQLFPIFNKNFKANIPKTTEFTSLAKVSKDWMPIGDQQYQIDAGQKAFGLRQCPQCDMQYSVHEPEDELLHLKYHNRVNILSFKGWSNERLVTEIAEWGLTGRIIYACETDSKAKKDRIKEILGLIDRDLGFAAGKELKPRTLVSFGIRFFSFKCEMFDGIFVFVS